MAAINAKPIRMNKAISSVIIVFIYLLFPLSSHSQPFSGHFDPSQLDDLKFSKVVEIRDENGSRLLPSNQAKLELDAFLNGKSLDDLKLLHKGYSKDESSYYGIVEIKTDYSKFRVFFYCEKIGGEYEVTKLRMHER